ncbi:hypothetical protein QR680_005124 [Steinernema hermaphroditum]|uniref:Aftiphilin clathrin-binding box domain-containing protein n=1 Tax=Steinernema hermaphroditum TaxID=289476 RepID=A0AA39HT78_9BILA|nr:hypothetical protein QR680_005124 [Steinernema hermaphroditum]
MYEDDDDEFGDFEEFGDFSSTAETSTTAVKPDPAAGDAWTKAEEGEAVEENDWAADFTEFSSSTPESGVEEKASPPPPQSVASVEHVPTIEELFEEDDFWSIETMSQEDEGIADDEVYDILTELDIDDISDDCRSSLKLWRHLRIVEETLALKFQWKVSAANTVLLRTLDMDVKKAEIKNSYLPAFAQQLIGDGGVLKPTQHVTSAFGSDSPPQPTSDPVATVASLSVEPVNFNWSDSVANEQKESSDGSVLSAVLQRDLDELGLNTAEDHTKTPATTQQSSSWNVDELLKKQQTARQSSPCEMTNGKLPQSRSRNELSLDAQALHDSLPDLDYMLSNVLMFPLPKTAGT